MRFIRASELGEYTYCHRAWWLRVIQGYASSHTAELAAGTEAHRQHGAVVGAARLLRLLAVLFALAALGLWFLGR
ncbi:MAG: hypothetical protein KA764_06125 [Anaerolineales bacterium]|nr:hypothetical protein [Anaerolineales bacterium]